MLIPLKPASLFVGLPLVRSSSGPVEIDMDANSRQAGGSRRGSLATHGVDTHDPERRAAVRSLVHAVQGDPDAGNAFHRHEGTFAAGQELTEHHPEFLSEKGSFASGTALRLRAHQGTFAEGQGHVDPHPEVLENRGGFAAGQRKVTGIRFDQRGLSSYA